MPLAAYSSTPGKINEMDASNCDISIEKDGETVNGKSIMGVMMLAAECGSEIQVTTKGPDAQKAIDAIERLVKSEFGE